MGVLVLSEHDNTAPKAATFNAIAAACELGAVTVLVAGHQCRSVAEAVAQIQGVEAVSLADNAIYEHPTAEVLAPLVMREGGAHDVLLAAATTFGKNVMPRIAALLDVQQVSDIIKVVAADTFQRPIYAGNAIATVKCAQTKKVITVRTTAFEAPPLGSANATISEIEPAVAPELSHFVKAELTQSERPELTAARVVVSGGRGMGSGENFKLLEALADKLGAALGASRAAVDAGYAPNDAQVGQTGKIVAPELYIAVGISGAIQHLAGMKDSRVIVAINKDEDAPIFQVADYGLVADLFTVLPELTAALDE